MKRFAGLLAAALVGLVAALPAGAQEHDATAPTHFPIDKPALQRWSFSGIFGSFDTAQLQRGFQVYKEVCAASASATSVRSPRKAGSSSRRAS